MLSVHPYSIRTNQSKELYKKDKEIKNKKSSGWKPQRVEHKTRQPAADKTVSDSPPETSMLLYKS